MDHLTNKVAVITGGASGIGFATARLLASRGVRLVLADIEESALDRAVAELSTTGIAVEGVVCDVGDLKAVQHLADTAFEKMGTRSQISARARRVNRDGPPPSVRDQSLCRAVSP